MYLGDFNAGDVIDFKFCTVGTTGSPTTLAGTPAVSIYKTNSTTESTTGITLTTDFDSRVGLHHLRIDTSADGTFYANANDFQVIITAGTVGGTSVVGYVLAHFSLRNRTVTLRGITHTSAVIPTVTTLTNDAGITQTGADKVWNSTSRTLTAFSTALAISVWDVLTANINTASSIGIKLKNWVLGADNKALLSSDAHTGAVIPTVTSVTNDVGITQIGADKVWSTTARSLTDKVGFALSSAGIQAIWDALTSALTTASSIGKLLVDNINGTISSRATQTSVDIIDDFIDTEIGAIKDKTDNLPSDPSDASDIATAFGTVNSSLATIAGYIDIEVGAIKAKTDNLPDSPAATSDVPNVSEIADAIWDEDSTTHTTPNSEGERISTIVTSTLDKRVSGYRVSGNGFAFPGGTVPSSAQGNTSVVLTGVDVEYNNQFQNMLFVLAPDATIAFSAEIKSSVASTNILVLSEAIPDFSLVDPIPFMILPTRSDITDLVAVKAITDAMPYKKNTALNNFQFDMIDSTTGAAKTGLTDGSFTKRESIDGATSVALSGTITEVDATNFPGTYKISLTAGEMNGSVITFRFSATGCYETKLTIKTSL